MDKIISDKVKGLASKVEVVKGVVEQIVSNNLIDKEQREQLIKKLVNSFDNVTQKSNESVEAEVQIHSMRRVGLKVKTLEHFKGDLPKYQSTLASGFDVRAQINEPITLEPGQRTLVPTGLSFAIPEGYEIQARPRSGWAIRDGISLVNTPGTIDADYRGEVKIIIINHGSQAVEIKDQDRIAQLVVAPVVQADFDVVESLDDTERGAGGFGSTGKE